MAQARGTTAPNADVRSLQVAAVAVVFGPLMVWGGYELLRDSPRDAFRKCLVAHLPKAPTDQGARLVLANCMDGRPFESLSARPGDYDGVFDSLVECRQFSATMPSRFGVLAFTGQCNSAFGSDPAISTAAAPGLFDDLIPKDRRPQAAPCWRQLETDPPAG